eukprot:scaffold321164_cov19-Tisochrysis_lutea.AAC.1
MLCRPASHVRLLVKGAPAHTQQVHAQALQKREDSVNTGSAGSWSNASAGRGTPLLFAVCGHHKRQVPTADAHKRQ